MASSYRWIARVLADLERQGWTWRRGAGHFVAYPADKTKGAVAFSGTPGDRNSNRMALKQIERAGGDISGLPRR